MTTLITATTLSDLMNIIGKQKNITNKALRELQNEASSVNLLFKPDKSLTESSAMDLVHRVSALLVKYAEQPTLTELASKPSWEGGFVWGSSFAISAIVGTVFLNNWTEIFPEFRSVIRKITMRILYEHASTDSEETTPLIDRLLPHMTFVIKDQNGVEIVGEEKDRLIYNRVATLLQLIAQVLTAYGVLEIVEEESKGEELAAKLTPMGHRVYLHLQDVERYIEEVSELNSKLNPGKIIATE